MTVKVFQIDGNMAIVSWDGMEDATELVKIIQKHGFKIKTLYKELEE